MSTDTTRRTIVKAAAAAATGPAFIRNVYSQSKEIVVCGAQPLTGIFSFAGVAMNNGIADYCAWRNANGGVAGHKLRYVFEDTGFKLDQGVAIFKKLMAQEKPNFFVGDSTQWCKAVARDAIESNHVMTTSTSCAEVMTDAKNMPHNFAPAPTYSSMHEILMEYIARTGKGGDKPKVALVYSDSEFGRDGIPASKARAEKLGLPIVADIVTKQSGVDVAPEVAKLRRARPDVVIFQGYVVAPIPEFVKQMREAGMSSQVMGTIWSMDKPTYDALGAMGESWMGVMPYRYSYDDKDSKMIAEMKKFNAANRPQVKDISIFYMNTWIAGMIFCDVAEKCIKANKPLTIPNMKAALESMKEWDSGGVTGLLADLSRHQIPSGRLYRYDKDAKRMEPASGWIKV